MRDKHFELSPFEPHMVRIFVHGRHLAKRYKDLSILEIAKLENVDLLLREEMLCDSVHALVDGRYIVTLDSTYNEEDMRLIFCEELIRIKIAKEEQKEEAKEQKQDEEQ